MAYKYNNGNGCVICNKCRVIIDEDLSYEEYAIDWADMPDLCMMCKDVGDIAKKFGDATKKAGGEQENGSERCKGL